MRVSGRVVTACRWLGRACGAAVRAATRTARTCRWLGWKYLAAATVCLSLLAADVADCELTNRRWPALGLGVLSGYCAIRLNRDIGNRP